MNLQNDCIKYHSTQSLMKLGGAKSYYGRYTTDINVEDGSKTYKIDLRKNI